MVNANNPANFKLIIIGLVITIFSIYIKQFFVHNLVVEIVGWFITIVGFLTCISGVFKILED